MNFNLKINIYNKKRYVLEKKQEKKNKVLIKKIHFFLSISNQ
jgi:hypothetical protein